MRELESNIRQDSEKFASVCQDLLARGLNVRFRAGGESMRPNILDGDSLVVAPASQAQLARWDVALTATPHALRAHRVVSVDPKTGSIITRGDAGLQNDSGPNMLVGRIIAVERDGRKPEPLYAWTRYRFGTRILLRRYAMAMKRRLKSARIRLAALWIAFLFVAIASSAQIVSVTVTQTAIPVLVNAGGTVAYTNTVNNSDSVSALNTPTLTQVVPNNTTYISSTVPAGWSCTSPPVGGTGNVACTAPGALGVGGTASFKVTVLVTAGTAAQTALTGAATVTSSSVMIGTLTASAAVTVAVADLSITQTAVPTTSITSGTIAYTDIVTNNGPSAALVPVLTQATPANTTFASVVPSAGWTCTAPVVGAAGNVVCTDGSNLSNAATATFTVNVTVSNGVAPGTVITGSASVSSPTTDSNSANNTATSTTTTGPADLAVTQTSSAPVVAAGTNVVFTITATNNGPASSQNVVVYNNIPANTTFQALSAVPSGWTCSVPVVNSATPLSCTNTTMASGASAMFVLTLGVKAATAAETVIQNVTSITSNNTNDAVGGNNTSISQILVGITGDADLLLTLAASPSPVFVSSPLNYKVTVQNLGVAVATSTTITDVLPTGVVFVSATPSQGTCTQSAGTVSCTLGTIAAAANVTVSIVVTAPGTSMALSNTASASSPITDPFPANNSATILVFVQPLSCATPARDGAGGSLSGIVNTYYSPATAGVVAAGTNSIGLNPSQGASTPISIGDLVLIIQMQDAAFNTTNTGAYGDGTPGDPASGSTNLNSAGRYEFVTASSAVSTAGGTLTVAGAGPSGGFLNTYTSAPYSASTQGQRTFQVIRVPQYQSATLTSLVVPLAWNGAVGGVLVMDVAGQLTLGGTVSANALGFRGGAGRKLTGVGSPATGFSSTDYRTSAASAVNGSKGEGIAGTPEYTANATLTAVNTAGPEGYPNGSYARGAPGNAGAGATDARPIDNSENAGGAGGGNGSGGGNGGYAWSTAVLGGGFGGSSFPGSVSALIMGGGGGAGSNNDGTANPPNSNPPGINSSGAAGGGIIILHAGAVIGTGTITANGQTALNVLNDGGGGGGAAGSIELLALTGGVSGATLSANGGSGGTTWTTIAPVGYPGNRHGPGGGGGGGVILTTSSPTASTVLPGTNGVSTNIQDPYGATPGAGNGISITNLGASGFTQSPGTRTGAECGVADLFVTNAGSPTVVVPGGNISYTQMVGNNGPQSALSAVFSEVVPANTTFVSLSVPAGWSCTSPPVGGTGNISCTRPEIDMGLTSSFGLVVQVPSATPSGTSVSDTDTASSSTNDSILSNNSATVMTLVAVAASADIAVTNKASVTTVAPGGSISYAQTVINNGPSAATSITFTEAIPTNTTFASLANPSGWSCTGPAVGSTGSITCTFASLAAGASAGFTVGVTVGATVSLGTVISSVDAATSAVTDPNSANNTATALVTVSTAGTADLSVTKVGNPNTVVAGTNLVYTIIFTNNGPAAAASATLSDPFPANTTYVSGVTPTGWTCSILASTLSCTNPSVAASTSATFTETFTVASGTVAGTVIANTVTVGSTTPDPIMSNNVATANTTVASPTQADLSITKTASPEPVNQGDSLVYTITVNNNGPATALSVVVTDPLPSAVTYQSASTSVGTCSQGSATVTCNLGDLTNGQVVSITINVTASTVSTSSLAVNTASVTSPTPDPDNSNNSATVSSTITYSNLVQLVSFGAQTRPEGGTLLTWHTQEEFRNLGFNVYRDVGLGRQRLNPSLIAGSALFLRGGMPQHAAKTYRWIDPIGTPDSTYILEDVDLSGVRTSHGPASVIGQSRVESQSASSIRPADSSASRNLDAQPSNSMLLKEINSVSASPTAAEIRSVRAPRPQLTTLAPSIHQTSQDSMAAAKLSVTSEGWYRVTFSELRAIGFETEDPQMLQLFAEGIEQPVQILAASATAVGSADAIEFYGTGIDTPFSGTRVYWLVNGKSPGKRIPQLPGSSGPSGGAASFLFTVIHEDRTTYFATLLNGVDKDNFFGAAVTNEPVNQDLTVVHSDTASSLPTTLDVTLQGATDAITHGVAVVFNGASVGEMDFAGQSNVTNTFPVNADTLHDGINTVTLTALNGDEDISLVQSIALHYPHTFTADANWLRATVASEPVKITGFTLPSIHVYDISNPLAIEELAVVVQADGTAYAATAGAGPANSAVRTLLAFSDDQLSAPSELAYHAPSNLAERGDSASLIYITHPDFLDSIEPLKRLRESEGHSVVVVTTDQLFDAFNYGERSPFAIRDFLNRFHLHDRRKLQGVLFVGDASLDPRNYLGFGDFDFVPTRIIETPALKTASDDWFSDFNESGFATIPTGRLPVRTAAEAELVVDKIVRYEEGSDAGAWSNVAVLIADDNLGSNFSVTTQLAATLLPPALKVTEIFAAGQGSDSVRAQILTALNNGSLIVNYNGHGSTEQWSFSDLLDGSTAADLTNGGRTPVYFLMDCLNGFFQDVYTESLAESLLLAPDGGAVGVWASSGLTNAPPQAFLDLSLFRAISRNPGGSLGATMLAAKLLVTDPDVRRTWILFGDPALRLRWQSSDHGGGDRLGRQ
jgi:uncharacterized repeat protein (TIGR01451 family)